MSSHVFDVAAFRAEFVEFGDDAKYPDAVLSGYFSLGTCYLDPTDWPQLHGDCLQQALYLMTAHIAHIMTLVARKNGNVTTGVMTSSTIDKVSVTIQPPPIDDGWQAWLAQSPYGLLLWALLDVKSAGGFFFGGSCERRAFRKAGGRF